MPRRASGCSSSRRVRIQGQGLRHLRQGTTENGETGVNPTRSQSDDAVVKDAIRQLREAGKVSSGQLRNLTKGLRVVDGVLLFEGRVVVPTPARQDVLGKVQAGRHFGQRRNSECLEEGNFGWVWNKIHACFARTA